MREHFRNRVSVAALALVVLAGLLGPGRQACAAPGDVLWLGNDTAGDIFATDSAGIVQRQLVGVPASGIAFDNQVLYFSEPGGAITVRSGDGGTVLSSFTPIGSGADSEDMAWDTRQLRLWRIQHGVSKLEKINPRTGTVEATYSLPSSVSGFTNPRGMGVAYDQRRGELLVSFTELEPQSTDPDHGAVIRVSPNTGAVLGPLFTTNSFKTAGLGYDVESDTLWVGDFGTVRHVTRAGAVLSSFARPQPGGFVDGLEFIHHTAP